MTTSKNRHLEKEAKNSKNEGFAVEFERDRRNPRKYHCVYENGV